MVGEDYRRATEILIAEEQRGHVGVREELPNRAIEAWTELGLLGACGAGLLIGVAAFTLGRRPLACAPRSARNRA